MQDVQIWRVVTNSGSQLVAVQLPDRKDETGEAWDAETGEPIEYGGAGDVVPFLIERHRPHLLSLDRVLTGGVTFAIVAWTLYNLGWERQTNSLWRYEAARGQLQGTAGEVLKLENETAEVG